MARAHVLGRHRHVVDEAESPGHVGECVVARRAAQRVGRRRALEYGLGGAQGELRARQHRRPGAGADRAGGVGHMVAGKADDAPGPRRHVAARVGIGDDLVASVRQRPPGGVAVGEEIQIVGRVHRG
jgi:hypothetical protein